MTAQWIIQPRDGNLVRSYDPVKFWSSLTVVERHNVTGAAPGTWSVTAQNAGLAGMFSSGNGCILFRDGVEIMSGPITGIQRGAKVSTISGTSDTDMLADRIIFPDPTKAITAQPVAYDNRSGKAEDVLLGYIKANMGPGAMTSRQVADLRLGASLSRGTTQSVSGRLDQLANVVADVAEAGGLHVEVLHQEDTNGPYLLVTVRAVNDLSANVRFGDVGSLTGSVVGSDWSYTLTRPTVTDAIVAGGGQGTSRIFVHEVDANSETAWGSKIELLVDQRQTTDNTELVQAGTSALSDGANPVAVNFTVSDSPDIRYRRDWQVGDTVGVSIDDVNMTSPVREVTTSVAQQQGTQTETISAVVGSRDSSAWVSKTNKDIAKALRAIDLLKAN